MEPKKFNTSFSVADIMGMSRVAEVPKPTILVVEPARVQTTVADELKNATANTAPATPKKERPKWLQWAVDNKAILFCGAAALLLWVGIKKGVINWR